MNTTWVRIRSWHALVQTPGGVRWTRCGRSPSPVDELSDELPAGKSCETCLRLVARDNDRTFPDTDEVPA